MKVTSESWRQNSGRIMYQSSLRGQNAENDTKNVKEAENGLFAEPDMDTLSSSLKALSAQDSEKSGSNNFRMKSSAPDDSVGQLAAMLARAESRIDVQQVASKAIRALTNLKMSAAAAEGKDAKKIARQIKRMEKLMKRIQKKLQHLAKEEQLERRRKKAEKEMEEQKAEELQKELNTRRKRRRKDEQNYANKEMAEDAKNSAAETISGMTDAISAASPSADISGAVPDISSFSADAAMVESVSIDVSV